jgi:hypothetical protein
MQEVTLIPDERAVQQLVPARLHSVPSPGCFAWWAQ